MSVRHFLRLNDLSTAEAEAIVARASQLRRMHMNGELYQPLCGKTLAMIFEKSSTRTRVSFEAGMAQFGGHALFLSSRDTQLGRGEPIADTARVLSGMVDAIMLRNDSQAQLEELASYAAVPVINALTDKLHPCQLLADIQTWTEHRGPVRGKVAAWIGDGNNVCASWINAAKLFGFTLRIACPSGYEPDSDLLEAAGDAVIMSHSPAKAAEGADLLVTDVWASMGQEAERQKRMLAFADYQVNAWLMALAADNAVFLHCLPAHRGEEVSHEVIDGPQSLVWDEATNRLHAQKALLEFLLVGLPDA